MRLLACFLAVLCLTACASDASRGWSGSGATPFDSAKAKCEQTVAGKSGAEREAAYEACMQAEGWSRPAGN